MCTQGLRFDDVNNLYCLSPMKRYIDFDRNAQYLICSHINCFTTVPNPQVWIGKERWLDWSFSACSLWLLRVHWSYLQVAEEPVASIVKKKKAQSQTMELLEKTLPFLLEQRESSSHEGFWLGFTTTRWLCEVLEGFSHLYQLQIPSYLLWSKPNRLKSFTV